MKLPIILAQKGIPASIMQGQWGQCRSHASALRRPC